MSTLFEDVDFEEKVTFPIFFKMKQGGFIRIKENGDIMEMAERHGMLSFMCGNRYTERFKKAQNGELTKEFLEELEKFPEEERMGVRPWKKIG